MLFCAKKVMGNMEILHSWSVHLFENKKTLGIVMLCAMAGMLAYMILIEKSILFTILAIVAVIIPTYQFYFPLTFKVHTKGVRIETLMSKKDYPWESFISYDVLHNHFFLHTSERGTKKNRRGDVILRDATEIDKLRNIIDTHIQRKDTP